MPRATDLLAQAFLEHAQGLSAQIDPVRVLRARVYSIAGANVLIRAASRVSSNNRWFFGLNYIHAEEVANLDNPYFAFVCGSIDRTVIIPAAVLIESLPFISHDRNGEYKINIDSDLNVVLKGRGNRLDCAQYLNAWESLLNPMPFTSVGSSVEESFHAILQGRLLEIGNVRGYATYCPDKSRRFNGSTLSERATLNTCPQLQFSDYELLRYIDVLWFREKGSNFIPEYAFEVELSTGTWPGVGRMATLLDYSQVQLFVVSSEEKKFSQVVATLGDHQSRYRHVQPEPVGELYAAELELTWLRGRIGL